MKNILIGIILLSLLKSCANPQLDEVNYTPSEFINQEWAMDKLWEDGQAEVAIYDAEMMIYGQPRVFENPMITVKEEFNAGFNVKTDDYSRDDLFSVIKVNRFADIETPNYPYHYLTSLFYKRGQPEQLYKMTHTGQEWCGNTFKQFEVTPSGYAYDYNSYFDGYGDGFMEIEGNDHWWEDQLPYVLRALKFEDELTFIKNTVRSQINTKTYRPEITKASYVVTDADSVWQVNVSLEEGQVNNYTFEKDYPNLMLTQNTWYGYNMKLRSVSRYKYWR
jgi:hypothetical protein